jgi:hypothetical protein
MRRYWFSCAKKTLQFCLLCVRAIREASMGDLNAYKSYHLSKLVGCSVVYNDSKQVSYQTVANNFDREDNNL